MFGDCSPVIKMSASCALGRGLNDLSAGCDLPVANSTCFCVFFIADQPFNFHFKRDRDNSPVFAGFISAAADFRFRLSSDESNLRTDVSGTMLRFLQITRIILFINRSVFSSVDGIYRESLSS